MFLFDAMCTWGSTVENQTTMQPEEEGEASDSAKLVAFRRLNEKRFVERLVRAEKEGKDAAIMSLQARVVSRFEKLEHEIHIVQNKNNEVIYNQRRAAVQEQGASDRLSHLTNGTREPSITADKLKTDQREQRADTLFSMKMRDEREHIRELFFSAMARRKVKTERHLWSVIRHPYPASPDRSFRRTTWRPCQRDFVVSADSSVMYAIGTEAKALNDDLIYVMCKGQTLPTRTPARPWCHR